MGAVVFVDGALQNSCVFHPNIFDLWLDDTVISPRVGFAHCCHGYIQHFTLLVTDTYNTLLFLSLIHTTLYSHCH